MNNSQSKKFIQQNGVWLGFLVLALILTILTQGDFLSPRNLSNLIRQASINGILAAGMTVVILTGGIDLSIGSLVALCGIFIGLSQTQWGFPVTGLAGLGFGFVLSILAGCLLGLLNGFLISRLKLAPFVITLGMMVIARGLAMIFSQGSSISPMSENLSSLASGYFSEIVSWMIIGSVSVLGLVFLVKRKIPLRIWLIPTLAFLLFAQAFVSYRGIPYLAIFLFASVALIWFVLNRTVFGRHIYAIGSNEKAAYWAGVPIVSVKTLVYVIMGGLSGLAAVLLSGRLNSADPNAGQLFELDAIAAVVIGGVSLKGGRGSVLGSLIGALTMATLSNGMDILGVSSFYQMVLKGLIIVIAVSLDRNQREA